MQYSCFSLLVLGANSKMLDRLPPEIKTDILSRLPVDSLLRFRTVSKSWCGIIDHPDFVKTHLTKSIKTRSNLSVFFTNLNPNFLYKLRTDSLNEPVQLDNSFHRREYSNPTLHWDPGFSAHENIRLLGSCNGLLCLTNADERVFVLNPSTRKYKALPLSPTPAKVEYVSCTFGFGYDTSRDDYKVVRLGQYGNFNNSYFHTDTMVYDLKVDAWREVQGFPYVLSVDYCAQCAFVSQSMNWLVVRTKNSKAIYCVPNLILGFDLELETYRELALPGEFSRSKFDIITMRRVEEWLSIVSGYEYERVDVWVMKEYGVVESWTKLISVGIDELPSLRCVKTFSFSADGKELLLEILPGNLVWYNLKEKCIKKVKVDGIECPIAGEAFHESLVSLGFNEVIGVKKEKKEPDVKKEKKEFGTRMKKRDDFLSKGFKLVL